MSKPGFVTEYVALRQDPDRAAQYRFVRRCSFLTTILLFLITVPLLSLAAEELSGQGFDHFIAVGCLAYVVFMTAAGHYFLPMFVYRASKGRFSS